VSLDLNDTATPFIEITDPTTDLLADATGVSVVITAPDGSTSSPAVTHPSLGRYQTTYTWAQVGRYSIVWTATGANAGVFSDVVNIEDVTAATIGGVSLDETRRFLGLTDRDAARDEFLRDIIDAATDVVEQYTRKIWRQQTITEKHDGGARSLRLRRFPVASVTTVVEFSTTTTAYVFDAHTGTIHRGSIYSGGGYNWQPGVQNITVTYVAGGVVIPPRVRAAILETIRELYNAQRGGSGLPRQQGGADGAVVISARAQQLLARDRSTGY
jgi:hypothetical protein